MHDFDAFRNAHFVGTDQALAGRRRMRLVEKFHRAILRHSSSGRAIRAATLRVLLRSRTGPNFHVWAFATVLLTPVANCARIVHIGHSPSSPLDESRRPKK